MSRYPLVTACCMLALALVSPISVAGDAPTLTLPHAIKEALQHDPWLAGNRQHQKAVVAESLAAASLPDPTLSLAYANLPLDTFDLNQEPMTQLQLGISQQFPRGDSRQLKARQLQLQSERYPAMRAERRAKMAMTIAQLWLELYRQRRTAVIIRKNRSLFNNLVDVAQSSYTSAFGSTRQQDLVQAQLAVTRLEDRLAIVEQRGDVLQARLAEWLPDSASGKLPDTLPALADETRVVLTKLQRDPQQLHNALLRHPALAVIDRDLDAADTATSLARQTSKPQWGVKAGYGWRQEDPMGQERADFFTVGVTLNMPLYSRKRKTGEVGAAVARHEALKTDRALLLRRLRSGFEAASADVEKLQQRQKLYRERLLGQINEQSEATLTAYTNDDGDFAETVRARIAELDARIDVLNLEVDALNAQIQQTYYAGLTVSDAVATTGGTP